MSESYITKKALCIEDENIEIIDYSEEKIKDTIHIVIHGVLNNRPESCPHCGGDKLIGHGYTNTKINHAASVQPLLIRLKKRRFLCAHCGKSMVSQTSIVEKNCSISTRTKTAILMTASNHCDSSLVGYAKQFHVSAQTIMRLLRKFYTLEEPKHLPEKICFDEFKSVKSSAFNMSFVFCDAENNHDLLGIIDDRRQGTLRQYFSRYPLHERRKVREICIDIYSPYITVIRELFPKARIVFDRFHIVQHINRALNSCRIAVMNAVRKKDDVLYGRLKKHWKFFLKDLTKLEKDKRFYSPSYRGMVTPQQVLEDLLKIDPTLEETYYLYQNLLFCVQERDYERFMHHLRTAGSEIAPQMKTAIRTFRRYSEYIENGLKSNISNGPIEGINNKIKTLKKIAYGFRNMVNFKIRIAISCNSMQMKIRKKKAA